MPKIFQTLPQAILIALLATAAWAEAPLGAARQLVLVTAAEWSSTTGSLQRFQKETTASPWVSAGAPIPVNLGRGGLGWGRGLHGEAVGEGPIKREGDGRAPAGVFELPSLFGYAGSSSPIVKSVKLPYQVATASVQCVDDVASASYNQIVERNEHPQPDWKSHEDMRRRDELYAWGVVVAHNTQPVQPHAGSCVFLHVWQAPGAPTSGCTAATAPAIISIVRWLSASHHPVLVQLPEREYVRLKAPWGLP